MLLVVCDGSRSETVEGVSLVLSMISWNGSREDDDGRFGLVSVDNDGEEAWELEDTLSCVGLYANQSHIW